MNEVMPTMLPSIKRGDIVAGSAGSVIANRLSGVHTWKVLLIEAGGDPTFESDIPGFSLGLPRTDLDWKFSIEKNGNNCLGMENHECPIFQGKALGGSSTINKMHYFRGSRHDYDEWESLGNKGWGYDSVLRYFKKSEGLDEEFALANDADFRDAFEKAEIMYANDDHKLYTSSKVAPRKYHSKKGLMGVNHFAYDFTLSRMKKGLCDAAEEMGIPRVSDVNWKYQVGCTRAMAVLHEGTRGNTAKCFLSKVKNRQNLFVVKNAAAERLIIEEKRVIGVELPIKEQRISVFARKEVVLAAGAINSPRLLLLSGIGPKNRLESLGIQVAHDLPGVGTNLQTHVSFFGLPFMVDREKSQVVTELQKLDAMYYFVSRGVGMFGNVGLNDVVTFANTQANGSEPDIQFLHYINRVRDHYTFNELLVSLGIKNEIRNQYSKGYSRSNLLLICPTLLQPKSRGKVELTSSAADVPPKISYDFFQRPEDLRTLIDGIRLGIRLTETKAFEEFDAELLRLKIEGCESSEINSDDYWECLIRHLATSTHDASSTCRMGPREDVLSVVGDELKVHGISGLRIADSSVMPFIVRGSTSVASVMIAEKASDLIKTEWKETKKDEL